MGGKRESDTSSDFSGNSQLFLEHFYTSLMFWFAGMTLAGLRFVTEFYKRKTKDIQTPVFAFDYTHNS